MRFGQVHRVRGERARNLIKLAYRIGRALACGASEPPAAGIAGTLPEEPEDLPKVAVEEEYAMLEPTGEKAKPPTTAVTADNLSSRLNPSGAGWNPGRQEATAIAPLARGAATTKPEKQNWGMVGGGQTRGLPVDLPLCY